MKLEEAKKKLDYHKNIIASLDEKVNYLKL